MTNLYNTEILQENNYNNIANIVQIAALLHDIGKANTGFQAMIKNTSLLGDDLSLFPEIVRHEFFSLMIVDFLLNSNLNEKTFKNDFASYVKNKIINKISFILRDEINSIRLLKLLISTHHKLSNVSISTGVMDIYNAYKYVPKSIFVKNSNVKNQIDLITDDILLLNFFEMQSIQEQLFFLKNIDLCIEDYELGIHIGRFALMSADHFISGNESFYTQVKPKDILAKGVEDLGDDCKKTQSLQHHLSLVQEFSEKFLDSFLIPDENLFTKLSSTQSDKIASFMKAEPGDPFYWQTAALNFVDSNFKKNSPGFFVVSSSTGSGKTLFSAKLANQISDNRFTVALGLRNLSLQTEKAYKNFIDDEAISLNIGSKAAIKLFRVNTNDYEEEDEFEEDENVTIKGTKIHLNDKTHHMSFYFNRDKGFLSSPIAVCTIDYLMAATNPGNQQFKQAFLRLKTSDLIIDEVDGYDINDLMAVGQLIYFAGMFNRKVIISTATANKSIVSYLYKMYNQGLKTIFSSSNMFWLTDTKIKNSDLFFNKKISFADFDDEYPVLIQSFIDNLIPSTKHKIRIKDISLTNGSIQWFIESLAKLNHEIDGDRKLSIGLFRVAHTKSALKVYRKLSQAYENGESNIFPILYHSQMFMLYRSYLENILDETLTRKNKKLKDTPIFNAIKLDGDITVVVIATPVEEVGRDHDFDWAIIEPSSSRSIIQTLGRVLRHRTANVRSPNVILMNQNFALQNLREKSEPIYSHPGYESKKQLFVLDGKRNMESLAPYFSEVNQSYVVSPFINEPFSYMENEVIKATLEAFYEKFIDADKSEWLLENFYTNNLFDDDDDSDEILPGLQMKFRDSRGRISIPYIFDPTVRYDSQIKFAMPNQPFECATNLAQKYKTESSFNSVADIFNGFENYKNEIIKKYGEDFFYETFNTASLSLKLKQIGKNFFDKKAVLSFVLYDGAEYLGIFSENQLNS